MTGLAMQTHFTDRQRADPLIRSAEAELRKCVHCGFCTATCPTYRLTGDELESPRGRIVLIQDLLETGQAPTAQTVAHLDHCLSCLSCETTCPSGVSYRRLIDPARALIESRYRRPWIHRGLRAGLAWLLTGRRRFGAALRLGRWFRRPLALAGRAWAPLAALARMLPEEPPAGRAPAPGVYPAEGRETCRVLLIAGCVQPALAPEIDAATLRLLRRHGCTVVVPLAGGGCCGALPHHLGRAEQARALMVRNLAVWGEYLAGAGAVDAVLMTASGCGSQLRDYGHLLPDDPAARELAGRVRDLSQLLLELHARAPLRALPERAGGRALAWQSPCSLQHGMAERQAPVELLRACGFAVREPRNPHLCCGSAGTYNLLQPAFATRLGADKAAALRETGAALIVSANIGCITQLRAQRPADGGPPLPVVHLAELLDWATGGPGPAGATAGRVLTG
ncbi:MAG: glycolate oxidase subunit GlcF [Pseudomonadota bacterium]